MLIQEHALFGWIMLCMKLQFLSSSYDRTPEKRPHIIPLLLLFMCFESFLVCFAIVVYLCLCCGVQLNVAQLHRVCTTCVCAPASVESLSVGKTPPLQRTRPQAQSVQSATHLHLQQDSTNASFLKREEKLF